MLDVWLFWICIGLLVYVYAGYPVVLLLFSLVQRPVKPSSDPYEPAITILFSARDEAESLPAKLQSLERLDYPREKLQVLAVSDGSSDETARILSESTLVQETVFQDSVGKNLALNHIVPLAEGEILVFTDANTEIAPGALRACTKWFANPKVGFVAGHVPYEAMEAEDRVRRGSNVYWQYESWLRWAESRLGSVLVGAGGLMAMARDIWQPMLPDVANDFHLPQLAAAAGRKLVFEPNFVGTEKAAARLHDEFWRTRRIVSRGVRGTLRLLPFFLRKPLRMWQLISHKILRWCTVLFLIGAYWASYGLLDRPLYLVLFCLQSAAYLAALTGAAGHLLGRRGRYWWLPHVAFQALALQCGAILGVVTGLLLGAPAVWNKPGSAR